MPCETVTVEKSNVLGEGAKIALYAGGLALALSVINKEVAKRRYNGH